MRNRLTRPATRLGLATLLAGFVLLWTAGAARANFIFTASLAGANERPMPTASPGVGFATITYETANNDFLYDVTYSGLSGNATAAHIHVGPATGTGPIVLPFLPSPTGQSGEITGVLTNASIINQGTTGLNTLSDILTQMQAGNTYVNIHSTLFPGGEIRGQLAQVSAVPLPSAAWTGLAMLGLLGVVLARAARSRRA